MKRKIIKQAQGSSTIILPIKWIREHNLQPGEEVEVDEENGKLTIQPRKTTVEKKELSLKIPASEETYVRTMIVNAYRSGFDIIHVQYGGKEDTLHEIIDKYLIGFEMHIVKEGNYTIEAVSEPSTNNFEEILQRQFHSISLIVSNLNGEESVVIKNVQKVQRYDNFLKRCLSKRRQNSPELWQLLSNITQIARACVHCKKFIEENEIVLKERVMQELTRMFSLLKQAFLRKDISYLQELHTREKDIVYREEEFSTQPQLAYLIKNLARVIYIAGSPLTGWIHRTKFQTK